MNTEKVFVSCAVCSGGMILRPCEVGKKVTCSRECMSKRRSESQLGEKSHRWQGGKTPEDRRIRNSMHLRAWKEKVFARDGQKCVNCGSKDDLSVDHIKPWAVYPALRFKVSNGRTLCWTCHCKIGDNPGQWNTAKRAKFNLPERNFRRSEKICLWCEKPFMGMNYSMYCSRQHHNFHAYYGQPESRKHLARKFGTGYYAR